MRVLGWDIGGSNTKVCRVEDGRVVTAMSRALRGAGTRPTNCRGCWHGLAAEAAAEADRCACGHDDRGTVADVPDQARGRGVRRSTAVEAALARAPVHVFTVDGRSRARPIDAARRRAAGGVGELDGHRAPGGGNLTATRCFVDVGSHDHRHHPHRRRTWWWPTAHRSGTSGESGELRLHRRACGHRSKGSRTTSTMGGTTYGAGRRRICDARRRPRLARRPVPTRTRAETADGRPSSRECAPDIGCAGVCAPTAS